VDHPRVPRHTPNLLKELPMNTRKLALVAAIFLLPFAAAACGADSTSELDKGDLTEELEKSGMPTAQAECAADALIDADFTKDELDDLNAGKTDVSKEKTEAFTKAITKCVTADTGS
jgi:hypothetical protein